MKNILTSGNIKLSVKYGFLGIGMCGCSIGAACANVSTNIENNRYPYKALLINTAETDHQRIKYNNVEGIKKMVIGGGLGAGRNIEVGKDMFLKAKEEITLAIKDQFSDTDFLWVVAGLGGGTGTGGIFAALATLSDMGYDSKKIGLIITLPRLSEAHTVLDNALIRFEQIIRAASNIGAIILIDNELMYQHFLEKDTGASTTAYIEAINRYIANALHELNTSTSFTPHADTHFDTEEYKQVLQTPGFLHLVSLKLPASVVHKEKTDEMKELLKQKISDGILSTGYDLKKTKRVAMNFIADVYTNKSAFSLEVYQAADDLLEDIAPNATQKPISQYTYKMKTQAENTNPVYIQTLFAGLDFPQERINVLIDANVKMIEQLSEIEKKRGEGNSAFNRINEARKKAKQESENFKLEEDSKATNPFLEIDNVQSTEKESEKTIEKKNPFDQFIL